MNEAQTILLVDDDTVFTERHEPRLPAPGLYHAGLRQRGGGMAACSDFSPSHILLDLNMPGTSGPGALPHLLAAGPEARLVVLTGYSSIATAVEATRAGAVNYLCKPATIDESAAGLRRRRGQWRAGSPQTRFR